VRKLQCSPPPLAPAISRMLDRSESPHQAYHRRHHGARGPDGAPNLREPIKPQPSSRLRCTTPPRFVVGYADNEHHSASCLHQPALIQKRCPQEVERRQSIVIVRSGIARSGVSPGAARVSSRRLHKRCLQQGNGAKDTANSYV
jgi:hypothetical protein